MTAVTAWTEGPLWVAVTFALVQVAGSAASCHNGPPIMRGAPSRWRGRRKRSLELSTGASSDPVDNPRNLPSAQRRRDSITFGCLLFVLFVIYNANFRTIGWDDTYPTRFMPFSLLIDHSLYLDEWIQRPSGKPFGAEWPLLRRKVAPPLDVVVSDHHACSCDAALRSTGLVALPPVARNRSVFA